ncbi:MAG: phosphatidate cytidylyltransferase [bacterium]
MAFPDFTAVITLIVLYLTLAAATWGYYWLKLNRGAPEDLGPRLHSWWVMITLFAIPLILGPIPFIILIGFISFVALKEYVSMVPTRIEDRPIVMLAYFSIIINCILIGFSRYGVFLIFVPVYVLLLTAFAMTINGNVKRFLPAIGTLHWGLIANVYNLGYIAYLIQLPAACAPQAGTVGLVLFLLIATQFNDVAQYVWGKTIGRHKILPSVSPNKTWEGFIGGVCSTIILTVLIGPWLTPLLWPETLLMGGVIGIAGFAGDVTMSAIKRDLGVKDTSTLIPGHGGALDRLDSLTFTAPLYFHILVFFHFGPFAMGCGRF